MLPITRRILSADRQNLVYLAETTVLTRLAIGLLRVNENKPAKLANTRLNANEKRQGMLERFFVEIVGTIGYLLALHFGQDLTSKLFESKLLKNHKQLQPLSMLDKVELTGNEKKIAETAITDVFGKDANGLVARILYGRKIKDGSKTWIQSADLATLKGKLASTNLFPKIEEAAVAFVRRAKRASSLSILGGVGVSALFGGVGIQWVNDRVFAPAVSVLLEKIYGYLPSSEHPKPSAVFRPALKAPMMQGTPESTDCYRRASI